MLPVARVPLARRWLDVLCRRDPEHPAAEVWTVYYDTPRFQSLGEKVDSDYLKLKIRVRWYATVGQPASGPVFVEAKLRTGSRRRKLRIPAPVTAGEIAGWHMQDPRLMTLPLLLRAHGVALGDGWSPLLLIRYRRDRFVEPISRTRVSLDAGIAAAAVNRRWISTMDASAIEAGVLELKGGGDEMPLALRSLLKLGARQQSFSKLLAVYGRVTRAVL